MEPKDALQISRSPQTRAILSKLKLRKFLSFVLRHDQETIGLRLDAQGWARIDELIRKASAAGRKFRREDLLDVVAINDKKRFSLSDDGLRIRATQGHSVALDLGLPPREPPQVLYHGTATRFLGAIWSEGLKPQARQQVHLSTDAATALLVGQRHGKPIVLQIDAHAMHAHGFKFYLADNGAWLTDCAPPEFLAFSTEGENRPEERSSGIRRQGAMSRTEDDGTDVILPFA